jgi:HSP20 family protein
MEMASTEKKLPVNIEEKTSRSPSQVSPWGPLENLRRQVDQLFEELTFGGRRLPFVPSTFDVEPFWQRELVSSTLPAVDITEKEKSFELTAELPGMDEKNIEIKLTNGNMLIRGEKKEELEDKQKNYYLSERRYGSFERIFNLPRGVDAEHIEARFSKGILTVVLPKKPEAIKPEKTIRIKTS